MKTLAIAVLVAFPLAVFSLFADTILLNSGEKVQGELVSGTNDVVQIRVANTSRTIFSIREIPRAAIKEIQHENAEQRSQRELQEAYQEAQRCRLKSTSYPVGYYDQIIRGVFQGFQAKYPNSTYSNAIEDTIRQWTEERDKVAGGAIKWGGQWYIGDEAKKVADQIRAVQLLDDGDRQLGSDLYEMAITKYREALAIKPLPSDLLQQISQKVNVAAQKWKAAVSLGNAKIASGSQNYDKENQALQSQKVELQSALAQIQANADYISSAHSQDVVIKGGHFKHWFARDGHDFGPVLPDPTPLRADVALKQATIVEIDAKIAKNNLSKAKLQAGASTISAQLQSIDNLISQFGNDLAQAKAIAQQMEKDDARRRAEEASRLASAKVQSTAQPQVDTHSVNHPSSLPASVAAVASAPLPQESWLHTYWKWIVGGGLVLLIGLYLLRGG